MITHSVNLTSPFLHFFANYGATLLLNRKSAHSRETPRIGCSLRSQCLLGVLVTRSLSPIKVLCKSYGKKTDYAKRTNKSYCACPTHPMRAQAEAPLKHH